MNRSQLKLLLSVFVSLGVVNQVLFIYPNQSREAASSGTSSTNTASLVSSDIVRRHADTAGLARQRLVKHQDDSCPDKDCIFDDVLVALPLTPPLIIPGDGNGQGVKAMIDPLQAFPNHDCVVYGLGIHDDSSFEQGMTSYCDHVHAFDCTVELNATSVTDKDFEFHQTCIATNPTGIDMTVEYGRGGGSVGTTRRAPRLSSPQRQLEFQPLSTVMEQLGHDTIDLLKFDIEGAEWELLENEILNNSSFAKRQHLPRQLQFELHTKFANPKFVPSKLVQDKDKAAVHGLLLRLYDLGYRIFSKELNNGDSACAELAMVLV